MSKTHEITIDPINQITYSTNSDSESSKEISFDDLEKRFGIYIHPEVRHKYRSITLDDIEKTIKIDPEI